MEEVNIMRTLRSPRSTIRATGFVCSMLIAAALLLAACGGAGAASPASRRGARTASPTPTITWRTVTPPPGIELAHGEVPGNAMLAISPVDGHDAWFCVSTATASTFAIWATTDAGTSWRQVGTLVAVTPEAPSCNLRPDDLDPRTLIAGMGWGCGECGTLAGASYLSSDGGATWHRVPGEMGVGETATSNGITYALLSDTSGGYGGSPSPSMAFSTDGLRTWRLSGPYGLAPHDGFFTFWRNPTSSEVLAATLDSTLWRSPDAGATWARVNTPATQISLGVWIAAAPAHWLLCGGGPANSAELLCSADLGASWTPRTLYADTYTCSNCGKWGAPSGGTEPCATNVLTPTGALLAVCPPNGTVPTPTNFALYRLAPNATTWTALGAAPGPWLTVPATGPVWCSNGQQGTLAITLAPIQ